MISGFRGKNHFQIFGVSGNLEIDFSIDLSKCLRTVSIFWKLHYIFVKISMQDKTVALHQTYCFTCNYD